jgi:hypothetical protein
MNLFIVGWSRDRSVDPPVAALEALRDRIGFFPGRAVERWSSARAAAAWVSHDPALVGGVSYADAAPDRLTLWSGHRAGRFARVTVSDAGTDVEQDRMGSYPLYAASSDGIEWVSNNAWLLRSDDAVSLDAVASLVAGGWSLSGDPAIGGVRRLPAGLSLGDAVELIGAGLDPDAAADELVDVTRALMDWPGRPNVVPVTAGRDSRLVLGAAMRSGIAFTTNTGGRPGEPDVDVGRRLAQIAGVDHELIADDPHGALHSHWRRAAELLWLTQGGTASLADAAGFPHGPREGPLPLWHSGQGGEIARGYYSRVRGSTRDALADSLYSVFAGRRPGRREPLNDDGERLVRDAIGGWVGDAIDAGAKPDDVPDLFYLFKRMGTWAGPTHSAVEYVRDTTSPLWHERMLPHLLALPAAERAAEAFHLRVLERLAPELAAAPGWPRPASPLRRRIDRGRSFAGKAARYAARRARARARVPARPDPGADPFAPVLADVRDAVLSQPGHAAWPVLDRARVESLLSTDAAALDEVSRYYLWRLATLFGP